MLIIFRERRRRKKKKNSCVSTNPTNPVSNTRLCYFLSVIYIGVDKSGYQVYTFLISSQKTCCGYSLEVPRRGTSNEYHNISFRGEKEKYQYFWIEKSALTRAMSKNAK